MVKIPDDIRKQIYTEEVRKKMSEKRKEYFANMTPEQRSQWVANIRAGKLKQSSGRKNEIEKMKEKIAKYKAMLKEMQMYEE